jgi:hypothetical protein
MSSAQKMCGSRAEIIGYALSLIWFAEKAHFYPAQERMGYNREGLKRSARIRMKNGLAMRHNNSFLQMAGVGALSWNAQAPVPFAQALHFEPLP